MNKKIKVLIVDNSAIFRQTLSRILSSDPSIEITATASDPYIAANKMVIKIPDVIITDIELPRMNGLVFLKKIMSQHPIRVIIISHLTESDAELTAKALQCGAVKVLPKTIFEFNNVTAEEKAKLCEIIKKAAVARIKKNPNYEVKQVAAKLTADAMINHIKPRYLTHTNEKVIVVGASTGGIQAISTFLEALPVETPGIVIVQHMPENFTKSFADRLNGLCKIEVKEAKDGDMVKQGRALIAPGNQHMLLRKRGAQYFVEVKSGPLVNRHRPSVDVLFRSAALYAGKNSVGILMTGMGDDGARGMLEMKESGAETIAQDEASCVVFGMPKEAILLKAVDKILPLNEMSNYMFKYINLNLNV